MGKQLGRQPKKAQVSMEFVFLVGLAFTVMVVFISSTRSEFNDLRNEEERTLLKDASYMVQHEIIIASNLKDGYLRNFEIPEKLGDEIPYNITLVNNTLISASAGYENVLNVPAVSGNIKKGQNIINKTGGIIYLN